MSAPFIRSRGCDNYYRHSGWWWHRPLRSQLHREILHHHLAQRWLLDGNDKLWCRCHLHLLLRGDYRYLRLRDSDLLRGLFDLLLGGHLNILSRLCCDLLLKNILRHILNVIIRCLLHHLLSKGFLDLLLLMIIIIVRHILSILVESLLHHLRKFSLEVVLVRSPLL